MAMKQDTALAVVTHLVLRHWHTTDIDNITDQNACFCGKHVAADDKGLDLQIAHALAAPALTAFGDKLEANAIAWRRFVAAARREIRHRAANESERR